MKHWNPRYVIFAEKNGRTPQEQLDHDKASGTHMMNFMLWIRHAVSRFKKTRPECTTGDGISDQDAFTAFLETQEVINEA